MSAPKRERGDLTVEIDAEAGAAYLRVRYGVVARTEIVNDCVHIDYGADGRIVGVEVLQ